MGNNIDAIISGVIEREGVETNDPSDKGRRTKFGISEKSNPEAWKDGDVSEEEAREIYTRKYVVWPKFNLIPLSHSALQAQLIDFGVNSGPFIAIQKLQTILGVEADGIIGPNTLKAIEEENPFILNNKLVKERVLMNCRIVKKDPSQLKYLVGWVNRAFEFFMD